MEDENRAMIGERRLGRFAIDHQFIEQEPAVVRALMGRCIVVRAEMMHWNQSVEYMAYSPDFAPVPMGMLPPWYDAEIDRRRPAGDQVSFVMRRA